MYRNPIADSMRKRKTFADSNLDATTTFMQPEAHQISSSSSSSTSSLLLPATQTSTAISSVNPTMLTRQPFLMPDTSSIQLHNTAMYSLPMFNYFFRNTSNQSTHIPIKNEFNVDLSIQNMQIENSFADRTTEDNDKELTTLANDYQNQTCTLSNDGIEESSNSDKRTSKPKLSFSIEAIIGIK